MDIRMKEDAQQLGNLIRLRLLSRSGILKAVLEISEAPNGEFHYDVFFYEDRKGVPSCNFYIGKDLFHQIARSQ